MSKYAVFPEVLTTSLSLSNKTMPQFRRMDSMEFALVQPLGDFDAFGLGMTSSPPQL
jgi:hypothetical protein